VEEVGVALVGVGIRVFECFSSIGSSISLEGE